MSRLAFGVRRLAFRHQHPHFYSNEDFLRDESGALLAVENPEQTCPPSSAQREKGRMMAGGPGNPLGARALYLGKTVYRIHGTNQPSTIGSFVSSGCIRLTNEDVMDLYSRVKVGTRVVVLAGQPPAPAPAMSLGPPLQGPPGAPPVSMAPPGPPPGTYAR